MQHAPTVRDLPDNRFFRAGDLGAEEIHPALLEALTALFLLLGSAPLSSLNRPAAAVLDGLGFTARLSALLDFYGEGAAAELAFFRTVARSLGLAGLSLYPFQQAVQGSGSPIALAGISGVGQLGFVDWERVQQAARSYVLLRGNDLRSDIYFRTVQGYDQARELLRGWPDLTSRQSRQYLRSFLGLTARQANAANLDLLKDWRRLQRSGRAPTAPRWLRMLENATLARRAYRVSVIAESQARQAGQDALRAAWSEARLYGSRIHTGGVFISRSGDVSSGPLLHASCQCTTRLVQIEGEFWIEWVARILSACPRCLDMDGAVLGRGRALRIAA